MREVNAARREAVLEEVRAELERAMDRFPPFNGPHEGYAVILEEVDELWDAVKAVKWDAEHPLDLAPIREEAIQVAAMAARFVLDLMPVDPR